ncbi:MAG TPA: ABC transporter substrate-binding protein [Alphaproteobacteria bacterium]|nr:ABC transporter substrate-binding protein [Alphaproteobacteria bacterium]
MRFLKPLASLALALVLAAAAVPARAETIKLGVVLTFSGVNAEYGEQITRAMDLYLKLHGSELGADKIEMIKRDSGPPTGAGAKTDVTELITQDHVNMLIGFIFSPDAIASAPVVTEAKVPMIVVNAGTAWITNLSPYIARTSFTMWQSGYPMGGYAAKKLGCKTAAVGYTDYPPGKDELEAFKAGFEGAGGKVVDAIPMGNPAQVPDFTPFLQRVKDEKPDCFYVFVPAGVHAAALVKTYGELNLKGAGIKMIGPADIVQDTKLQQMGDAAVGLITIGHYAADYDNPANKAFVKAWHEAYGANTPPDFMAVAGWDGMAAAVHAITATHGKLEPDAVMAALKGWHFDSPRGPITIDPTTRDIVQDEHIQEVVKLPDGKLGEKVLETMPAVKDPCKELKVGKCGS